MAVKSSQVDWIWGQTWRFGNLSPWVNVSMETGSTNDSQPNLSKSLPQLRQITILRMLTCWWKVLPDQYVVGWKLTSGRSTRGWVYCIVLCTVLVSWSVLIEDDYCLSAFDWLVEDALLLLVDTLEMIDRILVILLSGKLKNFYIVVIIKTLLASVITNRFDNKFKFWFLN